MIYQMAQKQRIKAFFHSRLLRLLRTCRELSNAPKEPPLFSGDENDSFISEIFSSERKEEEYDSQQSSSVSRSVLSKTTSHSKTTKKNKPPFRVIFENTVCNWKHFHLKPKSQNSESNKICTSVVPPLIPFPQKFKVLALQEHHRPMSI